MLNKEKIDKWQDNQEAHEAINMCLEAIAGRLVEIEKRLQELPTPDKTYYQPPDEDKDLDLFQNFTKIIENFRKRNHKVVWKPYLVLYFLKSVVSIS